ncbi:TonB-dependent hemoglobin/transferrin/lactoferrin family receptor [Yersinia ruckeri]|uniref:Putative TonB dependent receptor protein n=1 Tax=Yersinia ruckeri TaxID=29486 RepID=A0A0A8VNN8_YERRU|nr:TonB-dependent hemoglobin/transferrin/lactoferrin family receptor [Yersinia ruckeri]KGA47003.1 hasR protein [Yersinia ruckeri ATCC 29473]MCK8595766.1 TonB-dependent hemoglobin/transferrin/lactoferrin family receptor [Yersinia ruckeri]MCK8599066.1 TonB-dependent hemoglobin/transferrin/lactoferrin family receptor [Yersinia ruckeri]MCW6611080.1 TonB-dependent hemoglobin/transferrin/lactoferrin family receptor [Yersinia ruckeri]MCW6617429.1 TonB-dependent hemoglobin/transferrin/lactoferrin fami
MNNIYVKRINFKRLINITFFWLFSLISIKGYSNQFVNNPIHPKSNKNDVELETIKIEGSSNEHSSDWIYDEPRSISEITKEQLDNRPARHAADILEQTSGVYSAVDQQDPALSVNIRGIQDFSRINMNIDGMRQNFTKSGHGGRNGVMFIDPEILSTVVIEKGSTNGIGSGGVIGGITTFNTINAEDFLEPGKEIGGRLRAMTGDNGTYFIGGGVLALGNETGDLLLAASERNFGDYWPGNIGDLAGVRFGYKSWKKNAVGEELKHMQVLNSGYKMHTRLAKVGWNLPAEQRLVASYLQTQAYSPNGGFLVSVKNAPNKSGVGWRTSSISDVMTRNIALDYQLQPGHLSWLDIMAKAYYVDTDDRTNTLCSDWVRCDKYFTRTRLTTRGLQWQNTQLLNLPDNHLLSFKYGIDWFSDRSSGHSTKDSMVGVTPEGKRSLTSVFTQLDYHYDNWLRLDGGLRFDKSHLQGHTWLPTWHLPHTIDNPCKRPANYYKLGYNPIDPCVRQRLIMTWDVDRHEQQLLPTVAMGIKPGVQWLEFFGNYGKSWRPPGITEALATGSAHGSGRFFPNPRLAIERSRTWEAGFNIQQSDLLVNGDKFAAKMAYFDTRVTNYINLELGKQLPKLGRSSFAYAAFGNNLLKSRFRGFEYQLSYDAGLFYTNLSYTRMLGHNDSCSKPAWLGGVQAVGYSRAKGIYTVEQRWQDHRVVCSHGEIFGSSAYLPGDRGSLTLGGRALNKLLDFGTVIRYNRGYQDLSVLNSAGYPGTSYVADWPKYTIFDLYASYKLTNNFTLRGSIENINNRAYLVNYGDSLSFSASRGRTIQGGFEYKF